MGEDHPHVQVTERTNTLEALDKLSGPGGPLMLWLIDISGCGQRARFRRSSPYAGHVSHQQFGASTFGKLRGRSQCRAGGGGPIVRHQDMLKMPCD